MRSTTQRRLLEGITATLFVLFFIPLALVIINAAKDSFSITDQPLALPKQWLQLLHNMKVILTSENIRYASSFFSSLIILIGALTLITSSASMAAWVLVRKKTKLSLVLFFIFVAAMVVPFQVIMLPLISVFKMMGEVMGIKLLRSYFGMWFAYMGFGAPFAIFLFHGFIKSIPLELEEAARIDGCNKFQTFFYVVFPLLKPVYITLIILNGIWIWNDFLLPALVLGTGNDIQTIPLAVSRFVGSFVKQWDLILTALLMSMIPVVVLFLFGQKYIIKGMTEGAIK